MCVNDIIVHGAEPLSSWITWPSGNSTPNRWPPLSVDRRRLPPGRLCPHRRGDCGNAWFYASGEYDLAGFAVGVVERKKIIDGRQVKPGHVVIGLPSSGLHSNGYSLARKVLLEKAALHPDTYQPELGKTLGEELLTPTKIYVKTIQHLLSRVPVEAMAHITGGGLPENLPRILPPGLGVRLNKKAWTVPPIFKLLQTLGAVPETEMYRTFNMGIGFVCLVAPEEADKACAVLAEAGEEPVIIGRVEPGAGVCLE